MNKFIKYTSHYISHSYSPPFILGTEDDKIIKKKKKDGFNLLLLWD